MSYETITFDVRPDGIATMTLNRPKNLNCFNQTMFKEWNDVISRCAYDNNIRVLVLTGNGRAFSSGVDLSVLGSDRYDPAQFRYYYRQNHL
jgi:2-(1,2-epoxy-1,2-dihydrophenyl)acetyl-CoA isomerase